MPGNGYKFETLQLHAGQERPDQATGARAVPIYATTSYVYRDCEQAARRFDLSEEGHIYTRLSNPTTEIFERRVAALENGSAAIATASGAAAVTYTVMNLASAGQNIVSDKRLYGGTYNLFANTLPDYGIKTKFADNGEPESFERAIDENTRGVFVETIGNPNATIADIEGIARAAHKNGIPLIVDNTFATPYLFRPFEHGADIVVHSATKFIGGHGTCVGGAIIESGAFDYAESGKFPGLSMPNASYHGSVFTEIAGNAAF
ncbi:MAG: aminotransferase class I/II-fold pyridoxal phosphate-dependent enzyme, partial [Defluviitaleaceae bacterium]|nr:aminotransferase class I/II-fold pyridoxal phosphate-dependent enzyme [Defluviitaleaceae bacterium]